MDDPDRTAALMTPSKLAQVSKAGAPVSPAAWLNQMAADAGDLHLRRLAELRDVFETRLRTRTSAPLAEQLQQLEQALPGLDFEQLHKRGWWARSTGKSQKAGAVFAAQFERIDDATRSLASMVQAVQIEHPLEAAATERMRVEFEGEVRAIDKIVDQGDRWLKDMRNQLQPRQAVATDAQSQQQVSQDDARAEILVARLKLLRAVGSAAQQAHQEALATAGQRQALLQLLQQAIARDVKAWQLRLSALAAVAGDDQAPAPSVEGPMEIHRELQLCVQRAAEACAQLQSQEDALAASLVALGQQLTAAD